MELAYRLAVDDSPYIKYIRSHMIVLITPVVEVDGRDRMVDIYSGTRPIPTSSGRAFFTGATTLRTTTTATPWA